MKRIPRKKVEVLAPAGNWECLRAAVANGADAVYFGVENFNARVRAQNFQITDLPKLMSYLHTFNVRGYVTLNILIFENELNDVREFIHACMDAGVDALIVQDIGVLKLIREISPDFPVHASTQMTITSLEAIEFLKPYHLEVVVLGRENNLKQIQWIANRTDMSLEVFVHGAICVSYSGQCLTSEMLGGRSANRGVCAQACRLPYDLIVDGKVKEMGNLVYVLSPKDLATLEMIPEIIESGVTTLKIEGRLKSPEYVANVVSKYRKAVDEYFAHRPYHPSKEEMRELQQSFSRGFTFGFLKGTNNKQLLDGTFPKSRGVYIGTVQAVLKDGVLCHIQAPIKRGDGIVFDAGRPEEKEEGGRIYNLRKNGKKIVKEATSGSVEIILGRHAVQLTNIHVGDRIWKTSDPELERRLRKTFEKEQPYRLFPVNISVIGAVGTPLTTVWHDEVTDHYATIQSNMHLEKAVKRPLTKEFVKKQFGRLGGTIFQLHQLDVHLEGNVILPVKELNRIRREAVTQLIEKRQAPISYTKNKENHHKNVIERRKEPYLGQQPATKPKLIALCRLLDQVQAACQTDVDYIYVDFEFINDYPKAVKLARQYHKQIAIATPRIHMPLENAILRSIMKAEPDAILVRNLGAIQYYQQQNVSIPLIGDFSLNIANSKAVAAFLHRNITRVTLSYDLNIQQMLDVIKQTPSNQVEIVIHQHLPMFHTEHCAYCTFLSEGTDYTNCGRPCEKHRLSLRDRMGMKHPVKVDVGCRNTVYNAVEQSGAEYISHFLEEGIRHFRIEFLEEKAEKVEEVISLYREALEGERTGHSVWKELKALNQLGVTRGQLTK